MAQKRNTGTAPQREQGSVRIDKWLWAARFFKTRAQAKQAIDGGKVNCDGQRPKSSKDVHVGMTLDVRQGYGVKTVVVKQLSGTRRGAPEAALLYEETPDSLARRETAAEQRRTLAQAVRYPEKRPSKRERRQIHRFRDQNPG